MELDLTKMILAAGAVGTAAFGIVEAFKWTPIGTSGFSKIRATLGNSLMDAMKVAYGDGCQDLLVAQYRGKRGSGILGKTLRQGARIGLQPDNARALANDVGVVAPDLLEEAAEKIQKGESLAGSPQLQAVLGRFELAVDARIDAAMTLAESSYKSSVRTWAMVAALVIAVLGACSIHFGGQAKFGDLIFPALLVGLAAVPLAPIAKDVVAGIRSLSEAVGKKKVGA